MGKVRTALAMSLDGFIGGPNDGPEAPMGEGGERVLSRPSVELMTTDHLTPEQEAEAPLFFGDGSGWDSGVAIPQRLIHPTS
jgi:hypothetical protein